MEQKIAEIEQMFADCEKAHKDCVKMNNFLLIIGPIVVALCFASGVWCAFRDKPLLSFVEFFLCLYDGVIVYKAIGRRNSMKKDWDEFEARHRLFMEHLEELTNEQET